MTALFATLERDALLHIKGADTLAFLQGQLTCDTGVVDAGRAAPGVYCTPQGRVVADFLLLLIAEGHAALRLRRNILDVTAATLKKYIVFSKAELTDADPVWNIHACWGKDAAAVLNQHAGSTPEGRYAVLSGPGYRIVQTDADGQAFECLIEAGCPLAAELAAACTAADENAWEAELIRCGLARVEAGTSSEFVPQMLNYDLTGHISFKKGCYTGQEVVARLHYRGKAKRRSYVAHYKGAVPAPGSELFLADKTQNAGHVINAASTGEGTAILLVSAVEEALGQGLAIGAPGLPTLTLSAPPYPMSDR